MRLEQFGAFEVRAAEQRALEVCPGQRGAAQGGVREPDRSVGVVAERAAAENGERGLHIGGGTRSTLAVPVRPRRQLRVLADVGRKDLDDRGMVLRPLAREALERVDRAKPDVERGVPELIDRAREALDQLPFTHLLAPLAGRGAQHVYRDRAGQRAEDDYDQGDPDAVQLVEAGG